MRLRTRVSPQGRRRIGAGFSQRVRYASGGGPYVPTQYADLALWLRADDFVKVSDGTQVKAWTDRAEKGNDLANPSSVIAKQTVAGVPVLRFNGTTQADVARNGGAAFGMDSQEFTIVLVHKPGAVGHGIMYWGNQLASEGPFVSSELGKLTLFGPGGGTRIAQVGTLDQNNLQVNVITNVPGAQRIYHNGAVDNSAVGATPYVFTSPTLTVGSWRDSQYNYDGDIAELLVYDKALGFQSVLNLTRDLGAKYGIAVA